MDQQIAWGRSVRGCTWCGSLSALAGFEVKHDSKIVARLCTACAALWRPGWMPPTERPEPDWRRGRARA